MGSSQSIQKCNFEDIQNVSSTNNILLINTMNTNLQNCLIQNTISIDKELAIINSLLKNNNKNVTIYIYGKNSNDETILKKYNQLINLGFKNTFIYIGGMFEWLCLKEIYGSDEFPICNNTKSIITYSGKNTFENTLANDILTYKPITNTNIIQL